MAADHERQTDPYRADHKATSALAERRRPKDLAVDRETPGDFLDQTIAVWQPYSDRPLTREDAREMVHNVFGFFRVLREWAEEEQRSTASAESSPQLNDDESNSS